MKRLEKLNATLRPAENAVPNIERALCSLYTRKTHPDFFFMLSLTRHSGKAYFTLRNILVFNFIFFQN